MTPSPGDTLITLRTIGPLRRGDVVTVASTCADGEYLYLDGQGHQAFRAEHFMVAVRRPWWAWAEPGWAAQARAAADGFVRGGIEVGAAPQAICMATLGPDSDDPHVYHCDRKTPHRYLHSTGPEGEEIAWWCSCPDCAGVHGDSADSPSPSPAATEAEIRAKAFEFIAQRLEAKARAADLGATFWHGSLHGTSIYNFFTYAADEVRSLAAKETER